ncbi:EF-P beta-lysylation protein EpmB [Rubripirellula amarantea]|nr:EF-P beta-lysylation protein EpmB [Rubripirellula amarantea]
MDFSDQKTRETETDEMVLPSTALPNDDSPLIPSDNRSLISKNDHSRRGLGQILTTDSDFVRTGNLDQNFSHPDWKTAMKRAIRDSHTLRRALGLDAVGTKVAGEKQFPTFVPLEYLSRIRPGDPNDPLLRQVLPVADEDQASPPGYAADPVGDLSAQVTPALLHKYDGRALLITTGACGVHCRYCFRRQFPYSDSQPHQLEASLNYLRSDPSIEEVLLSGGDPLTLTDERLFALLDQIEQIDHIKRVRFHTRMPIVIPQRVTGRLVERLQTSRLTVWFVIHANHARELDSHVLKHLAMLVDGGIPVLNQAVLLAGVNDDVQTLVKLCQTLVDHRMMPYYLHQLDRVHGAAHFEVPIERGRELISELRKRLPGYAVPTYVIEEAGEFAKTVIPS